jgi:hypothetical protein
MNHWNLLGSESLSTKTTLAYLARYFSLYSLNIRTKSRIQGNSSSPCGSSSGIAALFRSPALKSIFRSTHRQSTRWSWSQDSWEESTGTEIYSAPYGYLNTSPFRFFPLICLLDDSL